MRRVVALLRALGVLASLVALGCADEHGSVAARSPSSARDSGQSPRESADSGRTPPEAEDGGPTSDATVSRGEDAQRPPDAPPPPSSECSFEPLQSLPEWRDDPARVLTSLTIDGDVVAVGGDGQSGIWALVGGFEDPKLIHLDAGGVMVSSDSLQTLVDGLHMAAGAEPLLAGLLTSEPTDLAGLPIDGDRSGVFIARRASAGFVLLAELEWEGPSSSPPIARVISGPRGNAFVVLELQGQGTLTSSSSDVTFTNADQYRAVIVALDADGRVRYMQPVPDEIGATNIALDASGRLLVEGQARVQLWNEAGAPVSELAIPELSYGPAPIMHGDDASNVYIALTFDGELAFAGQKFLSNGAADLLLLKYDAAGALLWFKQLGGTANEQLAALAADGRGNLLLGGTFWGTTDLGNGLLASAPEDRPEGSIGWNDAFVAKLTPDGETLGSARYGDVGNDEGRTVFAAGDDDAWLWAADTGPDGSYRTQLVRVQFDAASAKHESVTIDEPFTRLGAPNSGSSLATAGDTLLVGQTLELFAYDGTKFSSAGALERPADAPEGFGAALALTDELALVGGTVVDAAGAAPDDAGGAVYVYERMGQSFVRAAQLEAGTPAPKGFGHSVALVDGSAIVSAMNRTLYVFDRVAGAWALSQQLDAPFGGVAASFGWTLAARGSDLIVGHPGYPTPEGTAGALFVYRRSARGGPWELRETLTSSLAPPAIRECPFRSCVPNTAWGFGTSLVAGEHTLLASTGEYGETLAVYAYGGDEEYHLVDVFTNSPSDPEQPFFGRVCGLNCSQLALAVRGDLFAIGAPGEWILPHEASGVAYVYQQHERRWHYRGRVQSGDPVLTGQVGASVALYSQGLLVGAPGERGGEVFDLQLELATCR